MTTSLLDPTGTHMAGVIAASEPSCSDRVASQLLRRRFTFAATRPV